MRTSQRVAARARLPELHVPIERSLLACGAKLALSPRPGAPVAALQVHVRGGPALDPPGFEGCTYLMAATLDQGTTKHDEEKIAELLEPAGGEVAADANGLQGTIVNERWELLAGLVAEMLLHPTFPARQVKTQKERLLHRLEIERDDPRRQAALRFRRMVYGEHWLGRPPYGSLESVARLEPRHLRAHHARHWVAARALIAFCGDERPRALRREFERLFRSWKPGTALQRRTGSFPAPSERIEHFRAERQQVHVYLGHLGIRRSDPDYPALVVMDHVLGTGPGFTNRISRRLRDELGLAYSVNASIANSAGRLPGVFAAYIGTSKEHVGTAIRHFQREMRRIQREPVPREELEVAKSYLVGSLPLGFERASRRAGYLVSADVHAFPPDALEQLQRAYAAVTAADVQRVANKHLHPDRCCLCAAGPVTKRELQRALRST